MPTHVPLAIRQPSQAIATSLESLCLSKPELVEHEPRPLKPAATDRVEQCVQLSLRPHAMANPLAPAVAMLLQRRLVITTLQL